MDYYKENDGLKYVLEQRWNAGKDGQFPDIKQDLVESFYNLENFLNKKYHENVNWGAAISGDGLLTDHGVDHVQMVMKKAYKIIGDKIGSLLGYEIYLLLVAIHFHDIGNINGRADHEKKIIDIMNSLNKNNKSFFPIDIPEQETILSIAMAHGGYTDNYHKDKDTLRLVDSTSSCNGIKIRPIVLASILRFADELSDDSSRASGIEIDDIPEANRIFHAYSKSLEPINFDGKTVSFTYRVFYENVINKIKKGDKEVYLYDEIIDRISKCIRELEYCQKYSEGFIGINTLSIIIKIYGPESSIKAKETISFRLSLYGYPDESNFKISNFLVDENGEGDGSSLKYATGEELKKSILGEE